MKKDKSIKKSKKKLTENKKEQINKLLKIICNGVGLAMGVSVIVLLILKKLSTNDAIIMLGIGVLSVSIPSIMKRN